MKIWALDDGIPGHWSMTEGLIRLIGKSRPTEVTRVRVSWSWGALRHIFQRLAHANLKVPDWLVRRTVRFDPMPEHESPALLVSRGGVTLFPNAWLAKELGVPNIFIGSHRQMPASCFKAVIVSQDGQFEPPYYPLPLYPTRIDQRRLELQAKTFAWRDESRPVGRVGAMLIGGDGSGYRYTRHDWVRLAAGMADWHRKHEVVWCITTSRRTSSEAEAAIQSLVPPKAIYEAVWWHRGDRRGCVDAFLGAADFVFCTEDSMSMLEEVISSGLNLVSLSPAQGIPDKAFGEFLAQRADAGRLVRFSIEQFGSGGVSYPLPNVFFPVGPDEMENAVGALIGFLGLEAK